MRKYCNQVVRDGEKILSGTPKHYLLGYDLDIQQFTYVNLFDEGHVKVCNAFN